MDLLPALPNKSDSCLKQTPSTPPCESIVFNFHCSICNDLYDDPSELYEHMRKRHSELYLPASGTEVYDLDDDDSELDINDEDYSSLSQLLEPICEIQQIDEDDISMPVLTDSNRLHTAQFQSQALNALQPMQDRNVPVAEQIVYDRKVVLRKSDLFQYFQNCL